MMKAVITVVGRDRVGILAGVSGKCADSGINILEVTQSILHDIFAMTMLVDMDGASVACADFAQAMREYGEERGLTIHVMRDDVFTAMHRI
jgi:ACT domain-containing protein